MEIICGIALGFSDKKSGKLKAINAKLGCISKYNLGYVCMNGITRKTRAECKRTERKRYMRAEWTGAVRG